MLRGEAPRECSAPTDKKIMALPTDTFTKANDPQSIAILAKTIYRELRTQGYASNEVMTLAGDLLELVASEMQDRRDAPPARDVAAIRIDAAVEVSG